MSDLVPREVVLAEIEAVSQGHAATVADWHPCERRPDFDNAVDWFREEATLRIRALPAVPAGGEVDLIEALRENSWDLRCFSIYSGSDDSDIGWRVVGHWMAPPREQTIAEVYTDDPAAAVRAALSPSANASEGGK